MDYKLGRIERFDEEIAKLKENASIMKDESPDGLVVAISQNGMDGLTADLIDKMIYEFVECKVGISLIFSCDIPNGAATTLNLDDKTLQWESEFDPKTGDITVTIEFIMTGDQHESQIAVLRENKIDGYVLNLSKIDYHGQREMTDFIDYGELSSKGKLKFTIRKDQVKCWSLRSEDCNVCISKADNEYQDAYIHGIMIELKGSDGDTHPHYVMIGQCSVLPLFAEKDILEAIPFPHDNSDSVTVCTDEDLACEPEPDGYKDWDGESKNPVFEKYREKLKVLKNRADQWRCIFNMKDKSEFMEWSQEIADKAVNGRVQIHISEFFTWLLKNDKYDGFMSRLNSDLEKLHTSEAKALIANKLASYIHSEETVQKLLETRDAMNRLVIVMTDLMDSLKIKHDENGVMDVVEVSAEERAQFMKAVDKLPEKIDCDNLIHDLVVAVALDANLITEEQSKLPKEEVVLLEGYKTVFDNIAGIVKEFTSVKK